MLQEFVTIADQRFHVLFPNSKIHPVGKKGYTRNRIETIPMLWRLPVNAPLCCS